MIKLLQQLGHGYSIQTVWIHRSIQQTVDQHQVFLPSGIIQKSCEANPCKSFGQDILKEEPDEFGTVNCHLFGCARISIIFIMESDIFIGHHW